MNKKHKDEVIKRAEENGYIVDDLADRVIVWDSESREPDDLVEFWHKDGRGMCSTDSDMPWGGHGKNNMDHL